MDPNACIGEILKLKYKILLAGDDLSSEHMADLAVELAELVEALDGWLCKGGFMPDRWSPKCT